MRAEMNYVSTKYIDESHFLCLMTFTILQNEMGIVSKESEKMKDRFMLGDSLSPPNIF